jgi:inosine/xanthosine triphosphatase
VGSENEPKISAVRSALVAYAPEVRVEGIAVASGVPVQPVGLDEIVRGARNRAVRAGESGGCELGVGIEDGLVEISEQVAGGEMRCVNIGCAAITDGQRVSIGFSSAFAYPPECSGRAVRDREPIGELFDRLWAERREGSSGPPLARALGNIGKLTLGVLPRAEYARHAVLCALVAFLHPDLYHTGAGTP